LGDDGDGIGEDERGDERSELGHGCDIGSSEEDDDNWELERADGT
jgi:hypothetical protein